MAAFLVIGALALDRPIWLSAPVQRGGRVAGRSLDQQLGPRLGGGGANAGVALANSGAAVHVASVVSQDADGDRVLSMAAAAAAGLDVSLVRRREGASRTTLILIDPDGERLVLGLDPPAPPYALPDLPSPEARPDVRPAGVYVRAAYPGAAAWAACATGPVILHWPAPTYDGPVDVVVCSADDLTPEAMGKLSSLADALRATLPVITLSSTIECEWATEF